MVPEREHKIQFSKGLKALTTEEPETDFGNYEIEHVLAL